MQPSRPPCAETSLANLVGGDGWAQVCRWCDSGVHWPGLRGADEDGERTMSRGELQSRGSLHTTTPTALSSLRALTYAPFVRDLSEWGGVGTIREGGQATRRRLLPRYTARTQARPTSRTNTTNPTASATGYLSWAPSASALVPWRAGSSTPRRATPRTWSPSRSRGSGSRRSPRWRGKSPWQSCPACACGPTRR